MGHWRVDEVLAEGGRQFTLEGPVWTFGAVKSAPIAVREPNDVTVSPGEAIEAAAGFTITGEAKNLVPTHLDVYGRLKGRYVEWFREMAVHYERKSAGPVTRTGP